MPLPLAIGAAASPHRGDGRGAGYPSATAIGAAASPHRGDGRGAGRGAFKI